MLASRQSSVASLRRDAWVEVDLGAIEHNMAVVRSLVAPGIRIMSVVKSDAYGHGAVGVSELLVASGADWLGVASVDEGCQLRAAGIMKPILILSPCPSWALATAIESDLQLTLTSAAQLPDIAEAATRVECRAKIHVKIDSGMHRLGIRPESALDVLTSLTNYEQLRLTGVFSHLAKADDEETTMWQNNCFKETVRRIKESGFKPDFIHLASSDATRLFEDTHYDMVRPGLILYGLESRVVSNMVKPAMSIRGRINHTRDILAGESVGYNLTWTAQRPTRIASIPIGYADGVDRGLSNHMQGILMGSVVKQIGLISMDQMLFDITDVPQAQDGDVITLIGCENAHASDGPGKHAHSLYMATWANKLDTITYELACRMRARMPRIFTRHHVVVSPKH